jgi:hypothetical protein
MVSQVLLLSDGEYRLGADGVGQGVSMVKLHAADQEPEPQALDARTRQWYVPSARALLGM